MRFKLLWLAPAFFLAFLVSGGCGQKLERQFPNKALEYFAENAGCLNEFGRTAEKYLAGDITPEAWKKSCDCSIESLRLFKRYITGSSDEGYTASDLRAFVGRFLITHAPVSLELVEGAFELKASLLGGSPHTVTRAEIDQFIVEAEVLRDQSLLLLPHLRDRLRDPSPKSLQEFSSAVRRMMATIAPGIGAKGTVPFRRSTLVVMINELRKLYSWNIPETAPLWIGATKAILIGGASDQMEPESWSQAALSAGALGGPLIAALSTTQRDRALLDLLAIEIHGVLSRAAEVHGNGIPLSLLDALIDALPSEDTQPGSDILKRAARPVVRHLFKSRTPEAIDTHALNTLFNTFIRWNRRQMHLEAIFDQLSSDPLGVAPDDFLEAASRYSRTLKKDERKFVEELQKIAERFRPLFFSEDKQITLARWNRLSKYHLAQLNWIRLLTEHLVHGYANEGDSERVSLEGFQKFMSDFSELGASLGAIDTTVPGYAGKRFNEANLFTFASNGDKYIDQDEATYFLAMMFSTGALTDRIKLHMERACRSLGPDHMGGYVYEAQCVRREYFAHFARLWDHFPELVRQYNSMNDEDKAKMQLSIERAARPYGYSEEPMTTSDIQGLATIPHYVESLMLRADENGDEIVDLKETLKLFPVFRSFLAEVGGIKPDDTKMLEAVFTYTVHYSHPPKKNAWGVAHFLSWRAMKPFWGSKIKAGRRSIYSTVGFLNDPEALELMISPNPAESVVGP